MRLTYMLLTISGVQLFTVLILLGGWRGLLFAVCNAALAVLYARVIGQAKELGGAKKALRRVKARVMADEAPDEADLRHPATHSQPQVIDGATHRAQHHLRG